VRDFLHSSWLARIPLAGFHIGREVRVTIHVHARWFLAVLAAVCLAAPLPAQAAAPLPAQAAAPPRLDVPFVPTPQATVEAMLRVANVGPNDFVIDLGSGDGRILITAARLHGARGFGVDINPERVKEGTENAKAAGVSARVQFFQKNLYSTPIAEATVVTMYLLPRVNLELRPRLLAELKPGTRVVSHDFDMGGRIAFTLVDNGDYAHRVRFEGRVSGNAIEGVARGDGSAQRGDRKWRATRAAP